MTKDPRSTTICRCCLQRVRVNAMHDDDGLVTGYEYRNLDGTEHVHPTEKPQGGGE